MGGPTDTPLQCTGSREGHQPLWWALEHPRASQPCSNHEPPPLLPGQQDGNRAPCDCLTYTGINKDRFYLNKYQVYGLYNIHIMPLSPSSASAEGRFTHSSPPRCPSLRRIWPQLETERGGEGGVRGVQALGVRACRPLPRPAHLSSSRSGARRWSGRGGRWLAAGDTPRGR